MQAIVRGLYNLGLAAMILGLLAAAGLALVTVTGPENHLKSVAIWLGVAAVGAVLYRVTRRRARRRVRSGPPTGGGVGGSLTFTRGEFRSGAGGISGITGGGPQ